MTTPQAPPQQPQQQQSELDNPALIAALALLLVTATEAAAVAGALRVRFALSSAAQTALTAVLGQVMQHPPAVTGVIGRASEQTSRQNAARRAQYVIAATKRVMRAGVDARSKGEPVMQSMKDQLATEQRYYSQHQAAMWNRAAAAGRTDMEAAVHGDLLGWLAVMDSKTSAECRAANGKNFHASAMPDIGYPGSVHPHCRCLPSVPWPGAPLLPSRGARYARAA